MGVTDKAVYRAADDANDITVTHDFATLESARAFTAARSSRRQCTTPA